MGICADSAVSAALLKEAGYDVVGAFIKIWRPEFIECPWQEERLDAMRVCAHLGIPFKEIDLSDEYKRTVIDDMIENYTHGITPNPDVLCNRHIKFGAFKEWALSEGAEMIATGHYAQIHKSDGYELHRGKDVNKDQSYFLWRLTQDDLAATLFPVGGYTKPEVRSCAERFNLPVAKKRDSQGLCFVGEVTMRDFLARYITLEKGQVIDEDGNILGDHDGTALYTLGERHGFRIHTKGSESVPQYVIALDTTNNTITVSPHRDNAKRTHAKLVDTQWITRPTFPLNANAQARYREKPVACTIEESSVTFADPHLAPPGQSLVAYDGNRLIGGGVLTA